jgi:hypothetical protein
MNEISKTSELSNFITDAIDVSTTDIKKYMTRRGIFGSYVFENRVEEVYSISSSVFFSVQGITHFVLPWSIDSEEMKSAKPYNVPEIPNDPMQIEVLTNSFKKPVIF